MCSAALYLIAMAARCNWKVSTWIYPRGDFTSCTSNREEAYRWASSLRRRLQLAWVESRSLQEATLTGPPPGSSARDHLHLGSGPAGSRDEHLVSGVGVAHLIGDRRAVERHAIDGATGR